MLPTAPIHSIQVQRKTKEIGEYIKQCKPVRKDSKMYGEAK